MGWLLVVLLGLSGCHAAGTNLAIGSGTFGAKASPQPACLWAVLPLDGATLAECRDLFRLPPP